MTQVPLKLDSIYDRRVNQKEMRRPLKLNSIHDTTQVKQREENKKEHGSKDPRTRILEL